jgi:hypothetical protein
MGVNEGLTGTGAVFVYGSNKKRLTKLHVDEFDQREKLRKLLRVKARHEAEQKWLEIMLKEDLLRDHEPPPAKESQHVSQRVPTRPIL